jgi:hypothetical protein
MARRIAPLLLILALVFLPASAGAAKSYSADRFDVEWVVLEDGSLQVTETVVFRFEGGPFTYVFRELPTDYSDGIQDIRAALDGRRLPEGRGANQAEISGRDPIKITWRLPPTADATHAFILTYRVLGAVRQELDADLLTWHALPTDHEYQIASSTLTVNYPRNATLLETPTVRRGRAEVTTAGRQVVFTARDLKPDAQLLVALRFSPGSVIETPPQWQQRSAAARRASPPFIAAAIGVLLAGLLAMVAYLGRFRREGDRSLQEGGLRPTVPPANLPPAVVGALKAGGAQFAWSQALAALFDLARRGLLRIEESAERKWYRRQDFVVEQIAAAPVNLQPHERGLLALLFETKAGMTSTIKLSDLSTGLSSRWKKFEQPLKEDLAAGGYFDPLRQAGRNRLMIAGGILMALSAVALAGCILLMPRFEGWPFFIPGSLFLLGFIVLIAGAALSPLSDRGVETAARWEGFLRYLKDVTKGKEPAWDLKQFERYLPYAASVGLAAGWAKAFRERGGAEIPAWFQALSTSGQESMGAFVAMTTAAHSSGSSGAAGGAGGAGGGGGSGAG